jgi:hypothetical protein
MGRGELAIVLKDKHRGAAVLGIAAGIISDGRQMRHMCRPHGTTLLDERFSERLVASGDSDQAG